MKHSSCYKQPVKCVDSKLVSNTGGTWVSSAYIRNRGVTAPATEVYDQDWPDYLTNNPAPTTLYVRVAPSQYSKKPVFWINGWERPRLILTCGKKYQFNISTCGHPFYFTMDPTGGNGNDQNLTGIVPADYDMRTYKINPTLPGKFYYQCSLHKDMGGEVVIRSTF